MNNKMNTLFIYLIAAGILLGTAYFTLWFPSQLVIQLFLPEITQQDLAEKPYKDFSGLKPGNDIPRLEGMSQYEEGLYTQLDFVTVETAQVIPLRAYRLKDPGDVNNRDVYLGGRRAFTGPPLLEYTANPARRQYLYGRYYILGLSDGSFVPAFMDQAYTAVRLPGQKIQFPIGRLRRASSQEKRWFEEIDPAYGIDPEKVLYMVNDTSVKDFKFWDLVIRAAAVMILIAAAILFLRLYKGIPGRKK